MNYLFAKKQFFSIWFFFVSLTIFGQIPNGYYNGCENITGVQLQQKLHTIIGNHTAISYSQIWNAFYETDAKNNGTVWDMYSDVPNGTPPYFFVFGNDQCGTYSEEGDCYNREHTFPQSWFHEQHPMKTDLFHIYPTDGYVNNRRSNYPMGNVATASWTSRNGCKLGSCSNSGYSGIVFEPIDEYKGDFARTFFYMAVRYYNEDAGWKETAMTNGSQLKNWAMNLLQQWHLDDPVSEKELERNEAVYAIQGNRNPFIDCPDFVGKIWTGPASEHPIYDGCFPSPDLCETPKNVTAVKNGNTITITWQPVPNALSYSIFQNDILIDSDIIFTNYDDTNLSEGTYCYKIVAICTSEESSPSQEACETIVNIDETTLKAEIFPNPIQDFLHVSVSYDCSITLFDMIGNRLKHQIIQQDKTEKIDTKSLVNGIYILQIKNRNTGFVNNYKIVK